MNTKINIALVDDEALVLEGISLLLSNLNQLNVSVTANNGLKFLEILETVSILDFPDIALIDIQMKPMTGFELVEIIKSNYPKIKVIILSSHYKSNVVGHMIKQGISAFIPKNANKDLLITTIESVYKLGVYFTQSDQEMLMHYMNRKSKKATLNIINELSNRDIEVLKLICQELTNQEIADKLYLSIRTIESHRQRILDKVGAKNTAGLVIYAVVNQIHFLT